MVKVKKMNLSAVIVFYILACAISWPFFWWRDMNPESWQSLRLPGFVKTWSYMWGPGLSAIICFFLFKGQHQRTITFFGSSVWKSLAFYFFPFLALSIPGIEGMGMNAHLAPLVFSLIGFISILGEELGWRGFLQDAVRPLSPVSRYILIGVLWELWHFTNRTAHVDLSHAIVRVALFMVITILLSYIIGIAADKSRSLIVAVTLHSWVDVLGEFSGTWTFIIFGLSLPFWFYILWTWNGKELPYYETAPKENEGQC
jgi:uncharacterized protein